MLQVNNLTIKHKKDLRVIFEKFSITLNAGDKAVIIGEEGNGKSTLMKWIYNPVFIEEYTESEGNRIINKERLGYLPQELKEEDKKKTVYEFFSDIDEFSCLTPKEIAKYAKEFRISREFFFGDQFMETLSGGEKVKAQMLRLMMQEPTVLLLDEPSNDIDINTLEWLENVIKNWKHIVLFISHDETLIENTANKIVHIEQIHRKMQSRYTIANMSYQQYVKERCNQFEKQEKQAINDRREKKIRDEKYKRIYQSVEAAQKNVSRQAPAVGKALKDKMHTIKSMGRRFERKDEAMTEMPEQEEAIFFKMGNEKTALPARKIILEYSLDKLMSPDGEKLLAKDIFLRIRGNEKICLTGDNGVGKTTLLKQIVSELQKREDIKVEYMAQNYEDILELQSTPVDFLDQTGDKSERTRIRMYLGALKYTADEMDHPISELSGGQKAKIILLKMSLSEANVLVLDEPTRNFSPLSAPVIRKKLKDFPGAIISISHDRKYINEVCDKIYNFTRDGLVLENKDESDSF